MNMTATMPTRKERKKMPVKTVYNHVIRAKLYGVLTVNALEGIIHEIDEILPPDTLDEPLDVFSNRFRRYQNGALMPTSYGDHLDRAAKSLCKDVGVSVTIELFNTQAIKKVISSMIQTVDHGSRSEMIDWLNHPNDEILKSERYEGLINDACLFFYKESVNNINDDTLAFVRRSANELLRNKASKEALRKKLIQANESNVSVMMSDVTHDGMQGTAISLNEIMVARGYGAEMASVDPNQLHYMISTGVNPGMMNI